MAAGDSLLRFGGSELFAWSKSLLLASGLSPEHASIVADIYYRAQLRGVGHHDLAMLPQRLDWIARHGVNPRPVFVRTAGRGAVEAWEGDHGLGELCTWHATRRAMELAHHYGLGFATIRNSNHFLAAAPYTELGTEEALITMVWSNTDATMRYPGGSKAIIGNNPFGYGFPSGLDTAPWMFDICMAYASLGTLRAHAREGHNVPEYWGVDGQGEPCTDPDKILREGSISPMGDHKGFGLALLGEVLTGVLSGGPTVDQVRPGGGINTHNQAVLCMDPAAFGLDLSMASPGEHQTHASFPERLQDMGKRLKAAQPGLRIPGERSARAAEDQRAQGIQLDQAVYKALCQWSRTLGVEKIPQALDKPLQ